MNRRMILIRGLPGSGKTTLARMLSNYIFAADDYFLDEDGYYHFDFSKLAEAHSDCVERVSKEWDRQDREQPVVVHNTFSQRWEMESYLTLANRYGQRENVIVIDLFDSGKTDSQLSNRNVHEVPIHAIRAMRARWEHDWKVGNPKAPWER